MNSFLSKLLRLSRSMRFAAFLLIILGLIISLGTVIPQGLPEISYINAYGGFVSKIILFFNFNNIYSSSAVSVLFLLLCILSLICGVSYFLKKKSVKAFGILLIHLSLIFILSGAFLSGMTCEREYIELMKGESFTFSDGSELVLNDFNVLHFADEIQVRQFVSNVTYSNSKTQFDYSIKVNHPLRHSFVKFYQNSYGKYINVLLSSGDHLTIFDKTYVLLKDDYGSIYTLSAFSSNTTTSSTDADEWIFVLRQNDIIIDMKKALANESLNLGSFEVNILDSGYYTGLEYKRDLGVPVIYFGFIVLISGFLIFYFFSLLNYIKGKENITICKKWGKIKSSKK